MKLSDIVLLETVEQDFDGPEEIAEYLLKHCSDWPDFNKPLWRFTDSQTLESVPKLRSTRKRLRKSKGGTEKIQKYIFSLPEYKDYPDRTKSVFCSTNSSVSVPSAGKSSMTCIFPLNGILMGQTNNEDFNFINPLESVEGFYGLSSIKHELSSISSINNFSDDIEKCVSQIKEKGDSIVTNDYDKEQKYLVNLIQKDKFKKLFTPDSMGINLVNAKTIKHLNEKQTEVWFEGKYVAVPYPWLKEVLSAIESIKK